MSNKQYRVYIGRGAEVLVGLTYLVAAGLKAQDINLFLGQILAYQVFTSTSALTLVALTALAVETFLGLSMILGSPWRKWVLATGAAMLVFFSGLIVYAWQVHGLKDCGCFGAVSFTPPQAIAKNLVFLALTGVAWYGLVRTSAPAGELAFRRSRQALPLLLSLLLVLVAVPQLGGTNPRGNDNEKAPKGAAVGENARPAGVFSGYQITTDFGEFDLGQGEYLVALLSMTCEHCMDSVPQINEYTYESALPQVVALCLEPEAGSIDMFQGLTAPEFPMYSIGNNMLEWSKICEGLPPRLCLVRDGVVQAAWNEDMPDYETLLAAVQSGASAETE